MNVIAVLEREYGRLCPDGVCAICGSTGHERADEAEQHMSATHPTVAAAVQNAAVCADESSVVRELSDLVLQLSERCARVEHLIGVSGLQ